MRSQDTVFVIAGTTGSAEGRELAWKFVRDNWKLLHERFSGGFLLSRLVKVLNGEIEIPNYLLMLDLIICNIFFYLVSRLHLF